MINLQYIENNLLYVVRMLQAARALMPHDEESENDFGVTRQEQESAIRQLEYKIDRLEELKRKARETDKA